MIGLQIVAAASLTGCVIVAYVFLSATWKMFDAGELSEGTVKGLWFGFAVGFAIATWFFLSLASLMILQGVMQ